MAVLTLYRSAVLRARIAYHAAALQHVHPLHEDVPYLVITGRLLTDQLDQLKAQP